MADDRPLGAAMSFQSVINSGRRAAERLMTDWVEISRVVGSTVDPLTGQDEAELGAVYEGKAKLQSFEGYEASREVISHSSVVQRMSIHLPVDSYRSSVGDVVRIVRSADPLLEGREYRVTQEAPFKTHATAYRIFVDFKAE